MGYAAAPRVAFIVYGIQTFLLHNKKITIIKIIIIIIIIIKMKTRISQ